MASYQSYIICTSPRSGSTLLCKLLSATNKSGKPDSHFHSPSVSDWAGYYNLPLDACADERELLTEIFRAACIRGTGNTGIFGLRLQERSVEYFLQKLRTLCNDSMLKSDVQRIESFFGSTLFIHLSRRNKLDQAISLLKANQTGLWHKAPDGTELDRTAIPQKPVYDAGAIARHLTELADMDTHWESWFRDQAVAPLPISYDELSVSPVGILARILAQLGVDPKLADGMALPVAKLADETSRLWAERFYRENLAETIKVDHPILR